MMRWIHPAERDRPGERDRADHAAEGARYGLSRELSLALWERACADSTDATGRTDLEAALARFHAIAARLAARGGRLQPDVGRRTRVGAALEGNARGPRSDALTIRAPGRQTLVMAEAWRWAEPERESAVPDEVAAVAEGSGRNEQPGRGELPGAAAVMAAMAALRPARAEPPGHGFARDDGALDGAAQPLAIGGGTAAAGTLVAGGEALPFRDHFERALGLDLGAVSARRGEREALRPLGARAATRGAHIDFFDDDPSRELVGHELVHVLQNVRVGAAAHGVSERGDAAEREAQALGPRLAAGQFVAPRARPSAALQLDREDNLNLQWDTEETLKKQFPKGSFIAEAKRLFALIENAVPAIDATATADQVWTAAMRAYSTESMTADNLRKPTEAYAVVIDALKADVAARLTLVSDGVVRQRAPRWPVLKEFCPGASPFVLLLDQAYRTVGVNRNAATAVLGTIPSEADFQRAMQDAWNQAREQNPAVPETNVAAAAAGFRDQVIGNVDEQIASVAPGTRVADYQQAMDEIARTMKTAVTPPKPAEVVRRVQAIANVPALRDMQPTDALDPSFEDNAALRLANAEVRATFLAGLAKRHPKDAFVAALLELYPVVAATRELRDDAEKLHDEEMARIRALVEAQSLAADRDDYQGTLALIYTLSAQPALEIPKVPRQYHADTADDDVKEQQYFAEHGLIVDDGLRVLGAEPDEARCIKNYLSAVSLAKNSENRVIAPIGPAPDAETPAPRGRLLVSVDHTGHATARLVERNPRTGEDIEDSGEATAALQQKLVEHYGLAGFDVEGGAVWATSEVHKLAEALIRVHPADREAVRGLTFVRAKNLDKAENDGRTLGLFTVRPVNRRIKLADVAFKGDQFAFAGTRSAVKSSTFDAIHEIAHSLEHLLQLDAQARLAEVERSAPQGRLFNDELDALQEAQPESIADELLLQTTALSVALMEKPRDALRVVHAFIRSVDDVIEDPGKEMIAACVAASNEMTAQSEPLAKLLSEDEVRRIKELKTGISRYVDAARRAPELRDRLRTAEADLAKKEAAHQVALDQARKELADATSSQDGKRSQRLQAFIDFVVQCRIPPTITTYAASSWANGKPGEFFAEAYALWRSDPQFLRRNFQPLYLYFEQGMHRKS